MLDELKHSLRALRRSPLSSLSAIGILAVAIGASAAVFTVVDKVLIRPLPLEDPHRVVVIWPRETANQTTIATVDTTGLVTVVRAGNVAIRATYRDLEGFTPLNAVVRSPTR